MLVVKTIQLGIFASWGVLTLCKHRRLITMFHNITDEMFLTDGYLRLKMWAVPCKHGSIFCNATGEMLVTDCHL